MIRKQIYLGDDHEQALKDISARQGRSEAEVVREAVAEYAARDRPGIRADRTAWEEAVAFMRSLAAGSRRRKGERVRVSRERLYEEAIVDAGRRSR